MWDGSALPSTNGGGPTFRLASPLALSHILRAPGQLGLGRAYVAGAIEVDDVDAALDLLDGWSAPPVDTAAKARIAADRAARRRADQGPARARRELARAGAATASRATAAPSATTTDVSNDFFALMLDESMTYSCAVWSRGAQTLERRSAPSSSSSAPSSACRAASACSTSAAAGAASPSTPRASTARRSPGSRSPSRRLRWRASAPPPRASRTASTSAWPTTASWTPSPSTRSPASAWVEHVGVAQIDAYAARLRCAAQAGRASAQPRHRPPAPRRPRGRPVSPSATSSPTRPRCTSRESSTRWRPRASSRSTSRAFAADYARTLREWARRLESRHAEAEALAGAERMRVWAVYLRAARRGFESGFTSLYQVRAVRGPMKQMPT